jgi:hypothetical protein
MSGGWSQSEGITTVQDFGGLTGISVTPSATINTKGAWASLGTLSADCSSFLLKLQYANQGQTDYTSSMDIGIGPSGSQILLISDIVLCSIKSVSQMNVFQHRIPLSLKAGTQIWARAAINKASSNVVFKAWLTPFANAFVGGYEYYGVDTVGMIGVGQGTVITSGSNLSGIKGSYTALNTTTGTAKDYAGFWLCFDLANNASNESGDLIDIAIGPSGSQKIILPDLLIYQGGVESPSDFEFVPIPIPAGSQIWARAANIAPATTFGITLYGVY